MKSGGVFTEYFNSWKGCVIVTNPILHIAQFIFKFISRKIK